MKRPGVGIDAVEISRFRALRGAIRGRFLVRFFSGAERRYCERFQDEASRYAGIFAAKEAVIKALGGGVAVSEIEIVHAPSGQPAVRVRGRRRREIAVSITRTGKLACAVALTSQL